jgi:GxxExxY protein
LEDPLTRRVIGMAIDVHRHLGPGLLESVYESCLCQELLDTGVEHARQCALPVVYKGRQLTVSFFMDIVVDNILVLEITAVEHILPLHEAQLLTYLRLSGIRTGLLINFNSPTLKDGIRRRRL